MGLFRVIGRQGQGMAREQVHHGVSHAWMNRAKGVELNDLAAGLPDGVVDEKGGI